MFKYSFIVLVSSLLLLLSFVQVELALLNNAGEQKINFDFVFADEYEISGPRCISLVSKNVEANPYHPALVSTNHPNVRHGLGFPVILDADPILCPSDAPEPCSIAIRKTFTTTISNSYSISLGEGQTFSKSMGNKYFEILFLDYFTCMQRLRIKGYFFEYSFEDKRTKANLPSNMAL